MSTKCNCQMSIHVLINFLCNIKYLVSTRTEKWHVLPSAPVKRITSVPVFGRLFDGCLSTLLGMFASRIKSYTLGKLLPLVLLYTSHRTCKYKQVPINVLNLQKHVDLHSSQKKICSFLNKFDPKQDMFVVIQTCYLLAS